MHLLQMQPKVTELQTLRLIIFTLEPPTHFGNIIIATGSGSMRPEMHSTETFFIETNVVNLPYRTREKLLDGPALLIVTSNIRTSFNYAHQCFTAKGMVNVDRTRQLLEQCESNSRCFAIELSARALVASSPIFTQTYRSQLDLVQVPVHMGKVLPGYAMHVSDWYGRALQSRNWHDFMPEDPSRGDSER
jgi:hypothetical protein